MTCAIGSAWAMPLPEFIAAQVSSPDVQGRQEINKVSNGWAPNRCGRLVGDRVVWKIGRDLWAARLRIKNWDVIMQSLKLVEPSEDQQSFSATTGRNDS